MTIKRRIRTSNTLMIIMPMLITLVLGVVLSLIIMGVTGIDPRAVGFDRITFEEKSAVQAAIEENDYRLVIDDVTVYRSENGKYVIALPDGIEIRLHFDIMQQYYVPLLFVAFLLVIVYFTNRTLTRYVFRSIIVPIETLAGGVHEIRDGNLSYRIEYGNKDEFAAICADFNEMAQRLSDMVDRQQKEETNRRELIAGISHDLRTPLTSIKAYLEGLEKGVASSPQKQEKYLDTIKNKAGDLEYIINQLFLFSKLDIGDFPFHMEEVDIGQELIDFTDRHGKEYFDKGLTVTLTDNAENAYAEIDVVQFRNVIYNVLENSVRYKENDRAEVKIACHKGLSKLRITMTDNGPGVSRETLEKMFDVFYMSDAARNDPSKGNGLGLAISKKIVERLGGDIRAENGVKSGLSIEISLPLVNMRQIETGNNINV